MRTSERGVDLIKRFEGWRSEAYKDSVGVWTIGYGHTAHAGVPHPRAGMRITKEEGERILRKDLVKYEKAVSDALRVKVNQNQFDALVSFCYNVGPGNLRKSSVLRYTNEGRIPEVPARFKLWNRAGGRVLRGLTLRRTEEAVLFASKVGGGTTKETPKPKTNIFAAIFDFIIRLFMK